MAPLKYVIKCGNFAVLVDLHVLPLGDREDASWFTMDQVEEVTALVRGAVDQRVKQYTESSHNRRLPKHKKELPPASAFYEKGKNFNLAANFLKRHSNLRCIVKQLYGDLRVFPERYVVCVSCPEDASALRGNLSLAAKELSEQSRSEYFSRAGETQEPLHSSTKTKKTGLQKIAKQAGVQKERCASEGQQRDPKHTRGQTRSETEQSAQSDHLTGPVARIGNNLDHGLTREQNNGNTCADRQTSPNEASGVSCQPQTGPETSKTKRDAGEDPHPQRAKRACLERAPDSTQPHSTSCSTQTSRHDPLPPARVKADSKAFPVSEHNKTTLEVELLTPGKRAQRLPLTSNNTAQTNQNRLAASLRGLSVKPASSGSSISSRSTLTEEGSENVPRASRLRRLKRS